MWITLKEYNRRFDLIIDAFRTGYLNRQQASDAMRELTNHTIDRNVNITERQADSVREERTERDSANDIL